MKVTGVKVAWGKKVAVSVTVIARFLSDFVCVLLVRMHHIIWWRHQIGPFSALIDYCASNSPATGEFSSQKPVMRNGRHFADDNFKCIFFNENSWNPIKISLKFVPKGLINNIPTWVQIMVWRRWGAKPLFEPMMVSLLTHHSASMSWWRVKRQSMTDGSA